MTQAALFAECVEWDWEVFRDTPVLDARTKKFIYKSVRRFLYQKYSQKKRR